VIVEFDFAVLPGHRLLQDVCSARLAKEGVKLDALSMARFMVGKSFSSGLNALCAKQQKTLDVPAVVAECNEQFAAALTASLASVPAGFAEFVSALLAKGVKVVLVSRVDSEAVKALFPAATDKLVVVHESPSSFGFYSWDGWRRSARKNDLHDRLCVAVGGSGFSVKGALAAGMGALVKVNPETEYQDFGGCDVRIETYAAALANDVARILRM
jgi:beta-phosphoglucomutase-like phosphatase (HAD superfamily)